MITAETLKVLTTFTAHALTEAIRVAGYKNDSFVRSKFVGITNGGDFAYSAVYLEDGQERNTKVFLRYDPTAGRVSAEY